MIWQDEDGYLEQICDMIHCGIFFDMGTGKTAFTLALIDYKMTFTNTKKVLIIMPSKVTQSTWQDEMSKWENFTHLKSLTKVIKGTPEKRNEMLLKSKDESTFIHIISSDLLYWLYGTQSTVGRKKIFKNNELRPDYDIIVVDECSQMKDATTKRFKALSGINPQQLFLLSGTPFPNMQKEVTKKGKEYWINGDELYYVFFLLKLYDGTIYEFRADYCYLIEWKKNYMMSSNIYDYLQDKLDSVSVRKSLDLGIALHTHVIKCPIDESVLKGLKNDFFVALENKEVNAVNKAVMMNKTLQLANGFLYDELGQAIRINYYKAEMLHNLLSILDGNIMILYMFKEDKDYLLKNIEGAVLYENEQQKEDWNNGLIKYLVLSPFSCKFGLNIQDGGNKQVWFGMMWSGETLKQTIARLFRRGQEKDVEVYILLAENGFDEYVYERADKKTQAIDMFLEYMKK